jgi:hypothetical protein
MPSNCGQVLVRGDTFSSIIDGEVSENEIVNDDFDSRQEKERFNSQFFISRNDIPLFN